MDEGLIKVFAILPDDVFYRSKSHATAMAWLWGHIWDLADRNNLHPIRVEIRRPLELSGVFRLVVHGSVKEV